MAAAAPTASPPAPSAIRTRRRPALLSVLGVVFVLLLVAWLIVNAIKTPTDFFNVLLIGITQGSVYALVALGYTLVYGILQLINFAHGDVFALSGLFSTTVILSWFGLSDTSTTLGIVVGLGAAFLIVAAFGGLVNSTIEFVAYRRLRNAPRLAVLITAVGMSFIVQNISLAIYGVNAHSIPPLISSKNIFSIGGVHYAWDAFFAVLVTIPVLVLLSWLVKSTRQGKSMRATSQDPEAAAIMGIDVNRTISFTFVLAGALAGIAGVLYVVEFNMRYDTGFTLGLIAFTAAVLGGIGNLTGAVVGALIIGLIQAFNEGLSWLAPGSDWTRSLVFAILIAILVFRPEGLLGERTPEGA
jgi:branched-chain amino acid transport system permease protein